MKKSLALLLILSNTLLCSFTNNKPQAVATNFDGRAYDKNQQMDFTDSTEAEIKDYYDYDTMITKKGDALKSHLYNKISSNYYSVTYEKVWDWYKITDRNWDISNEIEPSSYKFKSETPDNYYLYNLYYEEAANQDKNKAINNGVNSYKGVEGQTYIDHVNKTKPKVPNKNGTGFAPISVDREHIWCKSVGFEGSDPIPNAGSDLHALRAADARINQAAHNNYPYGTVKVKNDETAYYCTYGDGSQAIAGYRGADSNGNAVFEPTDEWKGDIARAMLYMATRYSNDKGSENTKAEPYLSFSETLESDNTNFIGRYKGLKTFLEWNRLDPVSDFEKHRNNLIFKNVQRNRNPFIDYPNLATQVFDPNNELVPPLGPEAGFVNLKSEYNLHVDDEITLDIDVDDITDLNITYDNKVISLSADNKTVKALRTGDTELCYKFTNNDGELIEKKTSIHVKKAVAILSLKPDSGVFKHMDLVTGEEYQFEVVYLGDLFPDEKIVFSVNDPSIISISDDGKVTALKAGECTLTIILKSHDKERVLHSIDVKVKLSEDEAKKRKLYILIIVIASILLIGLFIFFVVLIKKSEKPMSRDYVDKVYHKTKKAYKSGKKKSTKKRSKK